jgi:hypothetical protein
MRHVGQELRLVPAGKLELPALLRHFAGPILDLLLQVRIRFAELRGHRVELLGERFELITGPHRNPLVQRARTDAHGSLLERLNRRHHLADEVEACQHCQQQAQQQQQHCPRDRRPHRAERLLQRLIDEHGPTQRGDRLVGHQMVAGAPGLAGEALALKLRDHDDALPQRIDDARIAARLPSLDWTDLRHLERERRGEIGVLEHQSGVRVGDQASISIHDVGVAAATDPDP